MGALFEDEPRDEHFLFHPIFPQAIKISLGQSSVVHSITIFMVVILSSFSLSSLNGSDHITRRPSSRENRAIESGANLRFAHDHHTDAYRIRSLEI